MSIDRVKRKQRIGFTLLEILLAMAILSLMALAIYRFVATNLTVVRISAEENLAEARYSGLLNLLTTQWQGLPNGALAGEPFKFNDQPRDEITWICGSGPGLLTRYAAGEFTVKMRLKRMNEGSDRMQIGFARKPVETIDGSNEGETWMPLLDDVRSLQIRYFDTQRNAWVDKWPRQDVMPRLVRLVVGRMDRSTPWEAVIALGRTPF